MGKLGSKAREGHPNIVHGAHSRTNTWDSLQFPMHVPAAIYMSAPHDVFNNLQFFQWFWNNVYQPTFFEWCLSSYCSYHWYMLLGLHRRICWEYIRRVHVLTPQITTHLLGGYMELRWSHLTCRFGFELMYLRWKLDLFFMIFYFQLLYWCTYSIKVLTCTIYNHHAVVFISFFLSFFLKIVLPFQMMVSYQALCSDRT